MVYALPLCMLYEYNADHELLPSPLFKIRWMLCSAVCGFEMLSILNSDTEIDTDTLQYRRMLIASEVQ